MQLIIANNNEEKVDKELGRKHLGYPVNSLSRKSKDWKIGHGSMENYKEEFVSKIVIHGFL